MLGGAPSVAMAAGAPERAAIFGLTSRMSHAIGGALPAAPRARAPPRKAHPTATVEPTTTPMASADANAMLRVFTFGK